MCDMAALSSRTPTNLGFTLAAQAEGHAGKDNPHGWGLALYPVDPDAGMHNKTHSRPLAARLMKEPVAAQHSQLLRYVKSSWEEPAMSSHVFLLHFRYSSGTKHVYRNTHPFERELWGRSFVLCHNGSYKGITIGTPFRPLGYTDSERVFCALLNWLGTQIGSRAEYEQMSPSQRGLKIHEGILAVASRDAPGTLNLYISDGEVIVAHARYPGNPSLFQVRGPAFSGEFRDREMGMTFSDQKLVGEQAVLVVTGPENRPDGPSCEEIPQGHSIVLHAGEVVVKTWEHGKGLLT